MTFATSGKRCRFGPPNPPAKIVKFSNKLGYFLNALKQSLSTTGTTHKRYSRKRPEVQSMELLTVYYGYEFSNAGGILFA
jgi:hypothetical protein